MKLSRSIRVTLVSVLGVLIASQPLFGRPRVECVPGAVCTPENPAPRHRACCHGSESASYVNTDCCIVTSAIHVDLHSDRVASPVPDLLAEPIALAMIAPAPPAFDYRCSTDRSFPPIEPPSPSQGLGARPPPVI